MLRNKELTPSAVLSMATKSGPGTVEKVDPYTVQFKFADPYFVFPDFCASPGALGGQAAEGHSFRGGYAPKHYLKQFHPNYASKEELDRRIQEAGVDNWINLFRAKNSWHLNPELPVVSAWKTTTPANTPTWVLERNPYSIWVDTEGNQLPYIDKVQLTLAESGEILNLRAVAGEFDEQERHLDLSKLPLFLENQAKGGYKVYLDPSDVGTDMGLNFNQTYDADPVIGTWLANTDFRRALSLGIDRDQLNETFWLGTGVPGSPVVGENSPYNPGNEYRTRWATYDPKQASEILDKLGLDKKDAEGLRLRPDGNGVLRLQINTYVGFFPFTQACEMITQHWKRIGILAHVQEHERSLAYRKTGANEHHIHAEPHWGTENMFSQYVWTMLPLDGTTPIGTLYGRWYGSSGATGKELPPRMREAMEAYQAALSTPEKERVDLGKKIWSIAIDEVWTIGTVGLSPAISGVRIAKTNLANVPQRMMNGSSTVAPGHIRPETFFFKR